MRRFQPARDIFAILAIAFVALRLANIPPWDRSIDAYAYWLTRSGDYYASSGVGFLGAYLYSPAFAQLLAPVTWLPWQVFNALWTALNLAALWYLVREWALLALLFLPIPAEIASGNVNLLIAAAIVVGFRRPAAWAFIILTKVTPVAALTWFAGRREWRSLAVALAVTAAIVVVSYAIAPGQWAAWIDTLRANAAGPSETPGWYLPVPLLIRLPVAAILAAWGGLSERRWAVPVAVTLALPVIWFNSLAILIALVPLVRQTRSASGALAPQATPEGSIIHTSVR